MKALGLLLGAGIMALTASQADATIMLYLSQDGYADKSYDVSSTGIYSGNYGTFDVRVSATGSGSPSLPDLFTNTIDISATDGGKLTVYLVQSGLSNYAGKITSSFTVNGVGSPLVDESTYFNGAQLAAFSAVAKTLDTSRSEVDNVSGLGMYTDAAKYVVTAGQGDRANSTINLIGTPTAAVPEPASWAMMLAGFGFMGFALRQRRTAAVSFG